MRLTTRHFGRSIWTLVCCLSFIANVQAAITELDQAVLSKMQQPGICVLLGDHIDQAFEIVEQTPMTVFAQTPSADAAEDCRLKAYEAGVYGDRIFVHQGSYDRIGLAGNLVDVLLADVPLDQCESEVRRVLRPEGWALVAGNRIVKDIPEGVDDWTHPYHGPDNNPQSQDKLAVGPYLTHFLADPRFGPSPQVAVAAGGRLFKLFGNVAWHEREESAMNKLMCFNAYNGSLLWTRELSKGYMIHRNTVVATDDVLYLADDVSCKVIDAASGKLLKEIVVPADLAGGTYWKWLAYDGQHLFALVGEPELSDSQEQWKRKQHGWPWGAISKGYNQKEQPWGYGRTFVAIDPESGEIRWHYTEPTEVDARAVCMKNSEIYFFSFQKCLGALNAENGKVIWRRTPEDSPELFEKLGQDMNRQGFQTNWRTTCYMKCGDEALFFAGPQVNQLLAVSTEDGRFLWSDPYNNFQLVLREDGLYAISGPWRNVHSRKFDPVTGKVLADLPLARRACTRPTGAIDAILCRALGGSVRFDLKGNRMDWISPMRPSCHDGVTIANGLLYWWPWVCDCQLTLYGVTCLQPAGELADYEPGDPATRLKRFAADRTSDQLKSSQRQLTVGENDWPMFRANRRCTVTSGAQTPARVTRRWSHELTSAGNYTPTAPVAVDGHVFLAGSDGVVHALSLDRGSEKWRKMTGGLIQFPPSIADGLALVGSGDGCVYAFDAGSGDAVWQFQAAPIERSIPVYGRLMSTWPVASGVLVDGQTAYAAAGIANYDGTYVYALDTRTGQLKWQNTTSGHLYPPARTGVCVQGHMLLKDDRLYLAGGTAVSPAVYQTSDGTCLNDPSKLKDCESVAPRGWELFEIGDEVVACGRPLYTKAEHQVYDTTVQDKLLVSRSGNRDVLWQNNATLAGYELLEQDWLTDSVTDRTDPGYRYGPWGELKLPREPVWKFDCPQSVAVAVTGNAVIVADNKTLTALDLANGEPMWTVELPASPVPWGLAVAADGEIVLSLVDGQVVCYGAG